MMLDDVSKALGHSSYERTKLVLPVMQKFSDVAKLESLLQDWSQPQGWVARQSGVDVYQDGQKQQGSALGHILSAELAKDNCSLQIRRLAHNWVATTITEGTGEDCLFDVVKHLTIEHGAAVYHRYWSLPKDGAAEVFACRFTGFEEVTK